MTDQPTPGFTYSQKDDLNNFSYVIHYPNGTAFMRMWTEDESKAIVTILNKIHAQYPINGPEDWGYFIPKKEQPEWTNPTSSDQTEPSSLDTGRTPID